MCNLDQTAFRPVHYDFLQEGIGRYWKVLSAKECSAAITEENGVFDAFHTDN